MIYREVEDTFSRLYMLLITLGAVVSSAVTICSEKGAPLLIGPFQFHVTCTATKDTYLNSSLQDANSI